MEGHDKTTGEQLRAGIAENKPAQPGEDGSLAASTARGASGAASHGLAGDTELPLDATRRAGSYGRHPVPPEEEGFYSPDTEASDGQVHCEKGVTHPAVASHCGAGLPAAEASLQAPPHVSQPQASPFQRGDAPASSIVDSRSPLQAPISSAADGGPNSPPARPNRLSYSPFPSVSSSWTSLGAPCGGRAGGDPGGGVSQWLDMTCAAFASSSFPSFALTRVLARTPSAVSSSHVNPVDGNASVTPQDLHACVGSRRCQIALCLGKKQRCNPLQNLDCPIAFAVVKLLKEGRRDRPAAGPETQGGEDVTRESLAEETPGSAMQRSSPCPTETADAALVIFKGKFATLVLNGIVTVEDVLVMEGLRCRPFFRPGRKEDLYSWAAESLHQLRASQTWGGGEETDPALRRVCVTHYLTLSDVYDDAKITVRPFAPSSAALPAFTLSAPELVTCCAFPASLPLPDWLLARNAQAPRSIFAARVLRRSNELKRARARAAGSRPPQGEPGGGEGECGGREGLGGGRREGGAQTAAPRGAREGAAEAEYVYTDLANLQANRGTNLYGVVWEVAKALMPQAGGKSQTGPAVFLMNVAIFDETVKFDLGRDTAPGGASEEFSLALKAKGCPGDIPCMSCGDIVRVHRANTGMKFEHDRNFVNLSSIIGVTSARVWPLEDADSDPCADNGFVVGAEVTTHFTEDDACRIRALRYHAQQLLQDNQLFTTQYYKPLAVLQRCSSGPLMREVYGDLIVRLRRALRPRL
ncbi:hypothetical protein BESB_058480 [Besnoitia besnoiti]|uniref:Uncharacterized protein n=1 Tax=Besnoitia besnoiti TaxID=94643 RepID=A0A2A9MFD0_BESBE|nr:hypothetical protein BESB_058480 [Besnoitia besnoiti]PFH34961.1 hypothetical protein BESB_058480 [Besnoitia besnoiti]